MDSGYQLGKSLAINFSWLNFSVKTTCFCLFRKTTISSRRSYTVNTLDDTTGWQTSHFSKFFSMKKKSNMKETAFPHQMKRKTAPNSSNKMSNRLQEFLFYCRLLTSSANLRVASTSVRLQSCFNAGISKLRPADHIRHARPFHPARGDILSIMKEWYFFETFLHLVLGRMQLIPKQSHHLRCPALELLCNRLYGPLTKRLEPHGCHLVEKGVGTQFPRVPTHCTLGFTTAVCFATIFYAASSEKTPAHFSRNWMLSEGVVKVLENIFNFRM